ncbi:MAG: hypothetical protein KC729_02910, partial [Candidatus Eisenbacteria bacterium]|nr:hypothetical protein [Candidatus Eisenbacteria bacterium]
MTPSRLLLSGILICCFGAVPSVPAAQPEPLATGSAVLDTLHFGFVGPGGFAVLGESWTWDHGGGDPMEGWRGSDLKLPQLYFRPIDTGLWAAGDNGVPAPILTGSGSAWLGLFQGEARAWCWSGGLGYGNYWCTRLRSPDLFYPGTGTVDLSFTYFADIEPSYDYLRVLLQRDDGSEASLNGNGFTGRHGMEGQPPRGTSFATELDEAILAGSTRFALIFEFDSDGGWSDEDGEFDTTYGPFAVDDLSLTGSLVGGDVAYEFETDLEGWMPGTCGTIGAQTGVASSTDYVYDDCDCGLAGNVLEMHDGNREHPVGQHELATSNAVDVLHDVTPNLGSQGQAVIFADWDQLSQLPRVNGVFYRPSWDYYPYECPVTGAVGWSGRVGQSSFFYDPGPSCAESRNVATSNGIPGNVERIRFLFEVYSSC